MELEKVKGEILAKISELLKAERRDLMEAMEVCRHLGALYSDLCHANVYQHCDILENNLSESH